GPGDVVAVTGSSDAGGTVTLAGSAERPAVGGHLALAPQPLAPTGMFGKVIAVDQTAQGWATTLVPAALDEGFADIEVTTTDPVGAPREAPAGAVHQQSDAKCEGNAGASINPSLGFFA